MNWTVLKAIFRRDFVSYFSNPTGYVFICVFVMLSALAAFWPPDFFSNNLANLDQLNKWLPFILLVFIPAITMSIWAEERRQHTDELLLTLPASDVDVVVGKYLAGVAIYTVALLFSMFSIYLVFSYGLGTPDTGLFLGTYVGYWFVGLAMLSIGMVASFLTSNLTVGFILGMVFNAPLAMFGVADWIIKNPQLAQEIKRWGAAEQFRDFERGVISLGGISYFVMIAVVMLYLSMVLIGRRHWGGREEDQSMGLHYFARTLGLISLAIGINLFLSHHNALRLDTTSEQLNSLSPRTVKLINELRTNKDSKTIKIDAYVSPQVPAEYASHKLNLLSALTELSSLSGGKIIVDIHEVENFSEEAANAEKAYGIEPRQVETNDRGARKVEEVFLGAVFTSGLDVVKIPFIDRGIPIEYELVRSICTVSQQQRKKLGVVKTDVPLFGGFSMQGPTEESQIVAELKKQYDVVEVDPSKPITEKYDVMLAVQPSSLNPASMENFVAAVKSGQPTAILEDPYPWPQMYPDVVGTSQPKRPQGGMMGMFGGGGPPEPKGDISKLWKLLGVEMYGDEIVWQDFNPEPKLGEIFKEWVFIDESLGDGKGFTPFDSEDPISSGLKQVLFFWPGSFRPAENSKLEFHKLAVTGRRSGTVNYQDVDMSLRSGNTFGMRRVGTQEPYIVAAHVTGEYSPETGLYLSEDKQKDGAGSDSKRPEAEGSAGKEDAEGAAQGEASKAAEQDKLVGKTPEKTKLNVVLISDIDWIAPIIFRLREMGQNPDSIIDFKFQNVSFVLNVLDSLAGDDRFLDLRKRSRSHRTLTKVEKATEEQRKTANDEQNKFRTDALQQIEEAQSEFRKKIAELENRTDLDPRVKEQLIERERIRLERQRDVRINALEEKRNSEVKRSERELASEIRGVQDRYKLLAVLIPPIPPVLLAFFVFFHRRKAEQEGVSAQRLRYGKAQDHAA
ncbi:MAG: Gldg family protein [Pirellulales bacterium]|nr:Gldg family protein [Pirellulales bacterium]